MTAGKKYILETYYYSDEGTMRIYLLERKKAKESERELGCI
jgi:hypothetical protein